MNGIEKLTGRIASDTERQRQEILEQARKQAAEIEAGYAAAADADYRDALNQGTRDAAEYIDRQSNVAQLDARKLRLAAKQEMMDAAFRRAGEKLLSLSEEEYAELLTKLAVDGCTTGREALVFSKKDRPRFGKRVVLAANARLEAQGKPGALTLSEESRDFDGGLYIQDGNIENNCTFSTILRILREQMAGEVARILFD